MKKLLAILMALIIILMTASVALGDGESSKKVEPRRGMCIKCNMGDVVIEEVWSWSSWEDMGYQYSRTCPHFSYLRDLEQVRKRMATEACTYCDYRHTFYQEDHRYNCPHV